MLYDEYDEQMLLLLILCMQLLHRSTSSKYAWVQQVADMELRR